MKIKNNKKTFILIIFWESLLLNSQNYNQVIISACSMSEISFLCTNLLAFLENTNNKS